MNTKRCGREHGLLRAVIAYMKHLAEEECGPGASHVCIWRGGKTGGLQ